MSFSSSTLLHSDHSLWKASTDPTAFVSYAAPRESVSTDVLIIGAGYCGLSAAIALRDAGLNVIVVDAAQPGAGGSGRNGGQIWPGLKMTAEQLDRHFGSGVGERAARLSTRAPQAVYSLIDRFGIECEDFRGGVVRAAHSEKTFQDMQEQAPSWQAVGDSIEVLDREGVATLTGSLRYCGGLLHRTGGSLHPLKFAVGLAKAAVGVGVTIFGNSMVAGLESTADGWVASFGTGANTPVLRAKRVFLATDAYTTRLIPALGASYIPLFSYQAATRRLTDAEWAQVCPGGHAVSDSQRLLRYFRRGPGQRLIMGGRGPFTDTPALHQAKRLVRYMGQVFPFLADVEIEYCWGGRVAMTTDHIPRLTSPAPNLTAAIGYNGFGVALSTLFGSLIGRALATGDLRGIDYPETRLTPIPLHRFHHLPVRVLIAMYAALELLS